MVHFGYRRGMSMTFSKMVVRAGFSLVSLVPSLARYLDRTSYALPREQRQSKGWQQPFQISSFPEHSVPSFICIAPGSRGDALMFHSCIYSRRLLTMVELGCRTDSMLNKLITYT